MTVIIRWTSKRKLQLILNAKRMTPREITQLLNQHDVSKEEFSEWLALYDRGGLRALHSTRLQEFHRRLPQ